MANLQANLRSQCAIALDEPQRVLRAVNQLFCENTPDGGFATLFFAEYEETTGRLRYVNCGHLCALLLRRDDTLERLDPTSTVLGIFKEWDCEMGESRLDSGDTLALYTDGITESFNHADEEFGEGGWLRRCGGIGRSLHKVCWNVLSMRFGGLVLTSSAMTLL
jgi:serine phosphatase RsbU (regulator of sigma subunit)